MAKKRYHSSYEDSKAEMRRDGAMINDDRSAPCLLPRNVIDKDWSRTGGYMPKAPMDLFDGANAQINEDKSDMRRELKPTKQ